MPEYDNGALDALTDAPDTAAAEFSPFPNGYFLAPEPFRAATPPVLAKPGEKPPASGFSLSHGPLKLDVATGVTANKPPASAVSPDPTSAPGGGAGEVRGELRYDARLWELYGRQTVGVAGAGDAPPSVHRNTVVGGAFQLPGWLAGGKVGASVSVAPEQNPNAHIEYRRSFGPAEAFVAADRKFAPAEPGAIEPPITFRGGISRKF